MCYKKNDCNNENCGASYKTLFIYNCFGRLRIFFDFGTVFLTLFKLLSEAEIEVNNNQNKAYQSNYTCVGKKIRKGITKRCSYNNVWRA